jgi:hypothetical protein
MHYRLRTLIILLILCPPMLAGTWRAWIEWQAIDLKWESDPPTETHPHVISDNEFPVEAE